MIPASLKRLRRAQREANVKKRGRNVETVLPQKGLFDFSSSRSEDEGGLERLLCARCARFSIAIAGNHKEFLHDYVSFRDRQPNVSHQYPKSSLMSTTCVRLPPGAWSNATVSGTWFFAPGGIAMPRFGTWGMEMLAARVLRAGDFLDAFDRLRIAAGDDFVAADEHIYRAGAVAHRADAVAGARRSAPSGRPR